jgi:hypothetical protein
MSAAYWANKEKWWRKRYGINQTQKQNLNL